MRRCLAGLSPIFARSWLPVLSSKIESYYCRFLIFEAKRQTFLAKYNYPESVATTWDISFKQVESKNSAAVELMRLCAYLAPYAIPETIFTKGASYLGPVLSLVAADAFLLAQAIEALRAYSLLDRSPQTRTLFVHPLIQVVLRGRMTTEEESQWKQWAVEAVHAASPDVQEVAQRDACEQWLPHALVCASWIEQEQLTIQGVASLLNEAGCYLKDRARYAEAEPLYQRALSIGEEHLGATHPTTALFLNNLAVFYENQGKYAEVEPLYQRALSIREQQLGAMHPDTATILNNLAGLYRKQGRYAEAEPL